MKLAVLISGNGSNLQAIIDAILAREIPNTELVCVLSNKEDAFGLTRARSAGLHAVALPRSPKEKRVDYDRRMLAILREAGADTIALAGFMRLLSPVLLEAFPERVLNIHPSLLPAFPGLEAGPTALAHGVKVTGVTVHFVDREMDTGPIIAQTAVPIEDGDDVNTLMDRIHRAEHSLYPEVLSWLARGELRIEGRTVRRSPEAP